MIELGSVVSDVVTGFTGTVTSILQTLGGLRRACVEAATLDRNGKPVEEWFYFDRLTTATEPAAVSTAELSTEPEPS